MTRVWAAVLLAAVVVGLAPGADAEPCLEVTGATNPIGDDHTCALWAKGKYFLRDDELENDQAVWHREESHVHNWGVVVRRYALPGCSTRPTASAVDRACRCRPLDSVGAGSVALQGAEDIRLVYRPGSGHSQVGWYLERSQKLGGASAISCCC